MLSDYASLKLRGHIFPKCFLLCLVSLATLVIVLFLSSHPAFSAQVTLAWDPNTEPDLAGYNLYYGYASRDYVFSVDAGTQTQYTIPDLEDGKTYFLTATSYNTAQVESDYSEEVTYTTPQPCTYSLSPTSQSFNASGGEGSVSVTTQSSCSWNATNGCSWITIISGGSGTGSGQVNYSVSANTSTSSRIATLTIAEHVFTVTQNGIITTYTITPTAGTGGSISPSGAVTVTDGANQAFTITPDTGYLIADVKADGVSVGAVSSYTFSNVTANHTIEASFAVNTNYTLSITKAGTGSGTVTSNPSGTTFSPGTVVTLTATPDANSIFGGWSGGATGTSPTCTVTMNANISVTATFTLKTYTITATAGTGGSISPSGSVVVNHGASQSFTITANTDYVIADVKVDGVSVGAVSSYTFSNVTANHTIEASFSVVPPPPPPPPPVTNNGSSGFVVQEISHLSCLQ